jgi:hypothetical protein
MEGECHRPELVYEAFSYFKREAEAISISLSLFLTICHPPSFVPVTL